MSAESVPELLKALNKIDNLDSTHGAAFLVISAVHVSSMSGFFCVNSVWRHSDTGSIVEESHPHLHMGQYGDFEVTIGVFSTFADTTYISSAKVSSVSELLARAHRALLVLKEKMPVKHTNMVSSLRSLEVAIQSNRDYELLMNLCAVDATCEPLRFREGKWLRDDEEKVGNHAAACEKYLNVTCDRVASALKDVASSIALYTRLPMGDGGAVFVVSKTAASHRTYTETAGNHARKWPRWPNAEAWIYGRDNGSNKEDALAKWCASALSIMQAIARGGGRGSAFPVSLQPHPDDDDDASVVLVPPQPSRASSERRPSHLLGTYTNQPLTMATTGSNPWYSTYDILWETSVTPSSARKTQERFGPRRYDRATHVLWQLAGVSNMANTEETLEKNPKFMESIGGEVQMAAGMFERYDVPAVPANVKGKIFDHDTPLFAIVGDTLIQEIVRNGKIRAPDAHGTMCDVLVDRAGIQTASLSTSLEGGMFDGTYLKNMEKRATQGEAVSTMVMAASLWRKYWCSHANRTLETADALSTMVGVQKNARVFFQSPPAPGEDGQIVANVLLDSRAVSNYKRTLDVGSLYSSYLTPVPPDEGIKVVTQLITYANYYGSEAQARLAIRSAKPKVALAMQGAVWAANTCGIQTVFLTPCGTGSFNNPVEWATDALLEMMPFIVKTKMHVVFVCTDIHAYLHTKDKRELQHAALAKYKLLSDGFAAAVRSERERMRP